MMLLVAASLAVFAVVALARPNWFGVGPGLGYPLAIVIVLIIAIPAACSGIKAWHRGDVHDRPHSAL